MFLLLFAVQVAVNLYATSVVGSVTYDAARLAAAAGASPGARADAEAHARRLLGRFGDRVAFDWAGTDGDHVVLRVAARAPGVLPAVLGGPVAFGDIDRTVRLRVERFR
jgi:hypothetical protein